MLAEACFPGTLKLQTCLWLLLGDAPEHPDTQPGSLWECNPQAMPWTSLGAEQVPGDIGCAEEAQDLRQAVSPVPHLKLGTTKSLTLVSSLQSSSLSPSAGITGCITTLYLFSLFEPQIAYECWFLVMLLISVVNFNCWSHI